MKIKLGDRAKDRISGFEGVVTARTEWLTGVVRYGLEPEALRDGKPGEIQWFDEGRLTEPSQKSTVGFQELPAVPARGGPTPNPSRQKDPMR
jgi:hypothetical protein